MILYHGSTVTVSKPEIRTGNYFLDFGNGFYTTTSYEQSERWAKIKMRRENSVSGFVSVYEFDLQTATEQLSIQRFNSADMQWLKFVTDCRKGIQSSENVDLRIGPVADDNVYRSIRLFETGVLNAEETIKRLKTEILHDQWTFHTQKSLMFLRFKETKKLPEEDHE